MLAEDLPARIPEAMKKESASFLKKRRPAQGCKKLF
jgi:hypothetical protein